MKIAIDATPVGVQTNDKAGVYRYIKQLLEGLAEIASGHEFRHEFRLVFNFCKRQHLPYFEVARREYEARGFEVVRARYPGALWMRGWVPAEMAAGRVDIFHGLYDFVPPGLRARPVVTIHDLRYVSLDEVLEPAVARLVQSAPEIAADYQQRQTFFAQQRRIIGAVAHRAGVIITPSTFSKEAIVDALGVSPDKVRVVPHGVARGLDEQLSERALQGALHELGIAHPFLLCVGKLDPLKNVDLLLRAFAQVARIPDLTLVLAGPGGWYEPTLKARARALGIAERVHFLGHVSDAELKALYRGAVMMAFPSLFEGFGLPVLEAMAMGCPVVCSDRCSLPEVAGEAARLVDPAREDAWVDALVEVAGDPALQARMRAAGLARACEFSWQAAARQTVAAYEAVRG